MPLVLVCVLNGYCECLVCARMCGAVVVVGLGIIINVICFVFAITEYKCILVGACLPAHEVH